MRIGLLVAILIAMLVWQAQAQDSSTIATPVAYLPLVARATSTPMPTSTPELPPPSYNNCQGNPNPADAPNYPVRITAIDKLAETVTLQNTSTTAIDLTNWHMCSLTGNQLHPIGGVIQPGQSIVFPNPAGSIWNNISPDPGALYTPDGRLASYRDA